MTEKRRYLLVADDDPFICGLVSDVFKTSEFQVLEARDGVEALMQINVFCQSIAVLLVDVIMPRLNGSELACVILSCHPAIKIIFMSGQSDDIVERFGIPASRMRFLKKPFTSEALMRTVREELHS
jgi:DNA-binding response OmpR family regulator